VDLAGCGRGGGGGGGGGREELLAFAKIQKQATVFFKKFLAPAPTILY
jgi:hypothetical protein